MLHMSFYNKKHMTHFDCHDCHSLVLINSHRKNITADLPNKNKLANNLKTCLVIALRISIYPIGEAYSIYTLLCQKNSARVRNISHFHSDI